MKVMVLLVTGFLAGVGLSRAYILSLRTTIKFYEHYFHSRLEEQWKKLAVARR